MAERAILEIIAEASDAIAEFDRLEKEFVETTEKMDRAIDEGIDSDEAAKELGKLEKKAERVADEMVDAGRKGTKALKEVAKSGKLAGQSQDDLQKEIKQTEERLTRARAQAKRFGDQSKRSAAQAKKSFAGVSAGLGKLRSAFLAVGGALVLREIIKATRRQAQAESILAGLVEQTGMAAGLTASQLKDMAGELQKVTLFGDEAVIEAQNIILTFTKIGKEVFPEVIERAADLATLMAQGTGGQVSVKDSAIQLGKALNDPIKNLSALSRAGIQFSAAQTEVIKSLVESGKLLEAQRIILKELDAQFGGTARAARESLGGALDALITRSGDLLEQIGGPSGLLFVLDEFSNRTLKLAEAGSKAEGGLVGFGRTISTILVTVGGFVRQLDIVVAAMLFLGGVAGKVETAIDRFAASVFGFMARIPGLADFFNKKVGEMERAANVAADTTADFFKLAEEKIRENRKQLDADLTLLQSLFDGTAKAASEGAASTAKLGEAAAAVAPQMDILANVLGPAAESEEELGEQAEIAAGKVKMLSDAAKVLVSLMESQQSAVANAEQEVSNLEQSIADLEKKQAIEGVLSPEELEQLFQAQDALADANFALSESQAKLAESEAAVAAETQNVTAAEEAATAATVALSGEFGLAAEAVAIVAEKFQADLVPVISEVAVVFDKSTRVMTNITEGMEEFGSVVVTATDEGVTLLTNALEEQTETTEDLTEKTADQTEAQKDLAKQVGLTAEELKFLGTAAIVLGDNFEGMQRAAVRGVDGAIERLRVLVGVLQQVNSEAQNVHATLSTIDEGVV